MAEKRPLWFASAVTRHLTSEIMRIIERVTRSEASLKELVNTRFKALDDRFKALEDAVNARFATLEAKVDGLVGQSVLDSYVG